MDTSISTNCKFTVLFEDPFWVGIIERNDDLGYSVARIVFGSEPTEAKLYEYFQKEYMNIHFSKPIKNHQIAEKEPSYKRKQREIKHSMEKINISSKAHEAMRLDLEKSKQSRKVLSKAEREAEEARQRKMRSEQKKEKHKGH
jgi:hypothetical protein